jgi:hypothetical protein
VPLEEANDAVQKAPTRDAHESYVKEENDAQNQNYVGEGVESVNHLESPSLRGSPLSGQWSRKHFLIGALSGQSLL